MKRDAQPAFAIWITGLPASGKSTLTRALVEQLRARGVEPEMLESDPLRKAFSDRPSYSDEDREYFYGALAFCGKVLTERGVPVIFDATANLRSYRDRARAQISRFIEVFVDCPIETCVARDPKGIYREAKQGRASHVPGLQAIYEPPEHPDVAVRGDRENAGDAAGRVIEALVAKGFMTKKSQSPGRQSQR